MLILHDAADLMVHANVSLQPAAQLVARRAMQEMLCLANSLFHVLATMHQCKLDAFACATNSLICIMIHSPLAQLFLLLALSVRTPAGS